MTAPDSTLLTTEHIELIGLVLIPIGMGIGYLIWQQAQMALKVDVIWTYFTNHQGNTEMLEMLAEKRNGRQGKR